MHTLFEDSFMSGLLAVTVKWPCLHLDHSCSHAAVGMRRQSTVEQKKADQPMCACLTGLAWCHDAADLRAGVTGCSASDGRPDAPYRWGSNIAAVNHLYDCELPGCMQAHIRIGLYHPIRDQGAPAAS